MAKKTKRTKARTKTSKAGAPAKAAKTKRNAPKATEVFVEGAAY